MAKSEYRRFGARLNHMRFVALIALAAYAVRIAVVAVYSIPSESMLPRLQVGDFFVVSKWTYGLSDYSVISAGLPVHFDLFRKMPARGDVVVFTSETSEGTTYIKRVIGLPGDSVEMREGILWLNGEEAWQEAAGDFVIPITPGTTCLFIPGLIDQRYRMPGGEVGCHYRKTIEHLPGGPSYPVVDFAIARSDTFGPAVVPEDHLFLMGDNRDASLDSRWPRSEGGLGMVPVSRVIGQARYVVSSFDGNGSGWQPWTWDESFRPRQLGEIR